MKRLWRRFLEFCLYTDSYRDLKREIKGMQIPKKYPPVPSFISPTAPSSVDIKIVKFTTYH